MLLLVCAAASQRTLPDGGLQVSLEAIDRGLESGRSGLAWPQRAKIAREAAEEKLGEAITCWLQRSAADIKL